MVLLNNKQYSFSINYFVMAPLYTHQDVIRFHICETCLATLHCNICERFVCKDRNENNLSDESKQMNFEDVPVNVKSILEMCECYCEQCNISFCQQCVSCREHFGHELIT